MRLRAPICIGLSFTLIAGCSTSAQTKVTPGELFVTPYISVKAPASGEWRVQGRSDTGITFGGGDVGSTFVASVMLFRLGPATTPEEYEKLIREGVAKDVDPKDPDRYDLRGQSVKYSTERPYPCVRYQAVSEDKRAKGTSQPQFLELDGLYCRHPMDSTVGVVIMYTHRGLTRYAALRTEAEAFIQGTTLPEN